MPLLFNAPIGDTRIEENRIGDARRQIPACVAAFNDLVESLTQTLARAGSIEGARQACFDHGLALWRSAGEELQRQAVKDDRPLDWARLQMLQQIRQQAFSFGIEDAQRSELLAALEEASRGRTSATFTQRHSKRILVSGFDPFGFATNVEGNIEGDKVLVDLSASNPSGAAAMELSNTVILHQGRLAEVQSVIFPVRYEDFDLGVVERFFRPYFAATPLEDLWVDMVITISRGRSDFDVERFTGRRRSSKVKDNAGRAIDASNALATASSELSVSAIPLSAGDQLVGPEFLESTLPIAALATMQSHYPVNDNRRVTILNEQGEAEPIEEATFATLAGKLSFAGSGGGFLSNEISYRTHLLREQSRRHLPVGHLHVPKPESAAMAAGSIENIDMVKDVSDPQTKQAIIVAQVKELVKAALLCL